MAGSCRHGMHRAKVRSFPARKPNIKQMKKRLAANDDILRKCEAELKPQEKTAE